MKTIWGHTIVKNEERFLWYAVTSVIDYLDKLLLWDTGSTDKTVEIAKLLQKAYPGKIEFKEYGSVDPESFTKARQEMLDHTESDWFVILDGDEVWWDNSIKEVINTINEEDLESIISPYYNVVGDIYHYQDKHAANYTIDGVTDFINIRAINRKIPGLHFEKPHGQQGLYDEKGILIQNRPKKYRKFIDHPYMHFTNIVRSKTRKHDLKVPKRDVKFKHDLGKNFPKNFKYPEVFYLPVPKEVPKVWKRRSLQYIIRSLALLPMKAIRRRLIKKVGY